MLVYIYKIYIYR